MGEITSSHLYRRISRLRWQALLLAFLLVLAHQVVEHTWLFHLPRWQHFATQLLFYGLVGPALAWWALTSLRRSVVETEAAERALKEAHHTLSEVNKQLTCLLRVNRRLTEAEDEEALLPVILELPLEVVPALGCCLILLDERQQPLPAIHHGNLDADVFEAWAARLADGRIRQQCAHCLDRSAGAVNPCTLLRTMPKEMDVGQVYCLELTRGGRVYGILSIFLPGNQVVTEQERSLLQAIAQEMSLALESHGLRARELDMLARLQQANHLSNLRHDLTGVLARTVEAIEAEGGVLFVAHTETAELHVQAEAGKSPGAALTLVKRLAAAAGQGEAPLIIGELEQTQNSDIHSLLIAPLHTENQVLGSLVLWSDRPHVFTRRHSQLVAIVAGQAARLVENQRLYQQSKQQAALAERARLAREIHDGLAQTLGYLKLRTSQVDGWLQNGESIRARDGLAEIRQLLSEAYVDAREAIDGLRLQTGGAGLEAWVEEIVSEFEALSGIPVEMAESPNVILLPEVQAQLQRIVQEALSNIRKHAKATHVWLGWQVHNAWMTLHISDDGRGFDPDDVPPLARHGLHIMRERADLVQAEFQITSHRGEGTEITVVLPLQRVAREVKHG